MKIKFPILWTIVLFVTACRPLAANPGGTPIPPSAIPVQPTGIPTVPPAPNLTLADFPVKTLMGEDERYAVYLINQTGGNTLYGIGNVILFDKSQNIVLQINGSFNLIVGGTIVSDDGKGEYLFLSPGTSTSRRAIVISLVDKKQAVTEFCTTTTGTGDHLFWNAYIIFNTCDTFPNRPWGSEEAPGITAINLKTGLITVIAKSDLKHQFDIKMVAGNSLQYSEISVVGEQDWLNPDLQITVARTYDLLSLK